MSDHKKTVVEKAHEYGDIEPLDDGYQYFWVKDRGAFSANDLRLIADELDRLNENWNGDIDCYFAGENKG